MMIKVDEWIWSSEPRLKNIRIDGSWRQMLVSAHAGIVEGTINILLQLRPLGNLNEVVDMWRMGISSEPFRAWRTAVLLSHAPKIAEQTIVTAFELADRRESRSLERSRIQSLLDEIGAGAYQEVMRSRVPDYIVAEALQRATERFLSRGFSGTAAGELEEVEVELREGTTPWREEFSLFGIAHPLYELDDMRSSDQVISRYPKVMAAIATDFSLGEKASRNHRVFRQLVYEVWKRSIANNYGDDVALAFALFLSRGGNEEALIGISHWAASELRGISEITADRVYAYRILLSDLKYIWHGKRYIPSP